MGQKDTLSMGLIVLVLIAIISNCNVKGLYQTKARTNLVLILPSTGLIVMDRFSIVNGILTTTVAAHMEIRMKTWVKWPIKHAVCVEGVFMIELATFILKRKESQKNSILY